MFVFRKFVALCFLVTSVLRFALLSYTDEEATSVASVLHLNLVFIHQRLLFTSFWSLDLSYLQHFIHLRNNLYNKMKALSK